MSKYGDAALLATKLARAGQAPNQAWDAAVKKIFPSQPASQAKNCPRCAFLALAEKGLVVGIPSGSYTKSRLNRAYTLAAIDKLRLNPGLSDNPEQLWEVVMAGKKKQYNQQMVVVTALWNSGDVAGAA